MTRERMTKKQLDRFDKIEQQAIDFYLYKSDFAILDWISKEDEKEYRKLYKLLNGECIECGELKNCKCMDTK